MKPHPTLLAMRKAVGYIRVSTKHQERLGCGLEAQRAAIEAFAKSEGYELVSIEKDVWTARGPDSLKKRPGLGSTIVLAQQTDAVILAWDAMRVSRDCASFLHAMDAKMPEIIGIMDNSGSGRGILAAVVARGQVEAENLMKRTSKGMEKARKNGVDFGNPTNLLEAREKGVLESIRKADEFRDKIARVIECYRAAGRTTSNDLVEALNADGILSPYGKKWTKNNIRHTLKRLTQ